MLNSTTKTNATTVTVAINAAINTVNVYVRGVAHSLLERLDYWLFSGGPDFYGTLSQGRSVQFRQLLQRMRQQPTGLIKRRLICCPVMSHSSGSGNFQAGTGMARSFDMCDR